MWLLTTCVTDDINCKKEGFKIGLQAADPNNIQAPKMSRSVNCGLNTSNSMDNRLKNTVFFIASVHIYIYVNITDWMFLFLGFGWPGGEFEAANSSS